MKGLLASGIAVGVVAVVGAANVSPQQAAAFEKKLQQILVNSTQKSDSLRETVVTEDEVNSYLRYSAGDQIPTGVTEPVITIQGQSRVHGRAIVDLDVVRRKNSNGGWFDPRSYLTGRLPVTATGLLDTSNGRGKFTLETATISGVPIPKTLLQELLSYYSRSDDYPNGINMDDPFDLPAEIQRIQVEPGRAIVIQ
jgi:hypothetical protein